MIFKFHLQFRNDEEAKVETVFGEIRKDEIPDVPSNFLYRGKRAEEDETKDLENKKKNDEEEKETSKRR